MLTNDIVSLNNRALTSKGAVKLTMLCTTWPYFRRIIISSHIMMLVGYSDGNLYILSCSMLDL